MDSAFSDLQMCFQSSRPFVRILDPPRADYLLGFSTPKISRERLHLPGSISWTGSIRLLIVTTRC